MLSWRYQRCPLRGAHWWRHWILPLFQQRVLVFSVDKPQDDGWFVIWVFPWQWMACLAVQVYPFGLTGVLSGDRWWSHCSFWCTDVAFTSSTRSIILFCCSLTAEMSSAIKSGDFFMSSISSLVNCVSGPITDCLDTQVVVSWGQSAVSLAAKLLVEML